MAESDTNRDTIRLKAELRAIPTLAGLPDEVFVWLTEKGEELQLAANDIYVHEGDLADRLSILLEGELHGRVEGPERDGQVYVLRSGKVSGKLPFSRMTHYGITIRAAMPSRVFWLDARHFPELIRSFPALLQRLVEVMSDRVREMTQMDERHAKLMALGKLSAGLAHELNNPAAAARRAAQHLGERLQTLNRLCLTLSHQSLTAEEIGFLTDFQGEAAGCLTAAPALDPLAESELEDEINGWLDAHGIADGWKLASTFVRAGLHREELDSLAKGLKGEALADALQWLEASWSSQELVKEIEQSMARISDLVRAIKEYSYMDRTDLQEVDVHQGLENTLIILGHKLKRGVTVVREYAAELPHIYAYGGALNQVWTNLIVNAIEAMNGQGKLWIRTSAKPDHILVEIADDGPGIPLDIQGRIFEPFFTTKPQGEGTGLGLDTAYRIVQKHKGTIRFHSKPGDTCFQVRLPLKVGEEK
ncbi:MAG: cyclic nucleotide-binding domain-containing protein [Blastocatellia bacterium]|nr:cyclic nucleotide-binding domain-containing protein [Blastocatellia bacterium]